MFLFVTVYMYICLYALYVCLCVGPGRYRKPIITIATYGIGIIHLHKEKKLLPLDYLSLFQFSLTCVAKSTFIKLGKALKLCAIDMNLLVDPKERRSAFLTSFAPSLSLISISKRSTDSKFQSWESW